MIEGVCVYINEDIIHAFFELNMAQNSSRQCAVSTIQSGSFTLQSFAHNLVKRFPILPDVISPQRYGI